MSGTDKPQPAAPRLDERRARPGGLLLIGIVLAVILVVVLVVLVFRPWTDGGAEPVEAPGVAPSAPLPER